MLREPISARDRWLALGLLVAALLVAYAVLVHPWWTVPMLDVSHRIDDLRQRDLRARTELDQAPQVARRLREIRAQSMRVPGFMAQSSVELAAAALVQRLETAVQGASPGNRSCAITNRQPLDDQQAGRFRKVTVQVRLTCGNAELGNVLYSLESGSPRLFVDNLEILSQGYLFAGDRAARRNAGLDVRFDLYGYLAPGTGAADAR